MNSIIGNVIVSPSIPVIGVLGVTMAGSTFAAVNASKTEHHKVKRVKASQVLNEPININKADAKTLAKLKRIGKKKAEEIVAYREQHGKFKSIEDLKAIKGISEKIIAANKENMTLKERGNKK